MFIAKTREEWQVLDDLDKLHRVQSDVITLSSVLRRLQMGGDAEIPLAPLKAVVEFCVEQFISIEVGIRMRAVEPETRMYKSSLGYWSIYQGEDAVLEDKALLKALRDIQD